MEKLAVGHGFNIRLKRACKIKWIFVSNVVVKPVGISAQVLLPLVSHSSSYSSFILKSSPFYMSEFKTQFLRPEM